MFSTFDVRMVNVVENAECFWSCLITNCPHTSRTSGPSPWKLMKSCCFNIYFSWCCVCVFVLHTAPYSPSPACMCLCVWLVSTLSGQSAAVSQCPPLCPAQRDMTRRKVTAAWCELSHRRFWLFAICVSCTVPIWGYKKNMGHGANHWVTFSFILIWNVFSSNFRVKMGF